MVLEIIFALAASFGLGFAANINPCVLPLYPGFLSYLSNNPGIKNKERFIKLSGLLVLMGILVLMLIIGFLTATLGVSITGFVGSVTPAAFLILLILGIILILGVDFNKYLPHTSAPVLNNPYLSAFVFGLFYGLVVIPCNAPLVFAIFAFSVGVESFLISFLNFIAFGLGLGIPLLALSLVSSAKSSWLIGEFVKKQRSINIVAGALLIILSLYELLIVFAIFGPIF